MSDTTSSKSNPKATLAEAIRAVDGASLVSLDIETTGLDPRKADIRLIQISDGNETYVVDCRAVDPTPLVQALGTKTVIAHGADFEWRFLYHHFGVELEDVRDTMLMARVLTCGDMSIPCGLGSLAERKLNLKLDKEMQVADWSVDKLTKRQLDYAAVDAQVLFPLFALLAGELAKVELEEVAALENAALPAVARMKLAGLPVDKAAWDANARNTEKELEDLKRTMLEADWLPQRDPLPQTWKLTGDECLEMLRAAGVEGVTGTTAKDLKPYVEDYEIVRRLLAFRKAKGKEREALKASVLELAPEKPSKPAPPWNFGSPKQVEDICFKLTGHHFISTDETHLLRYVKNAPFFRHMLEYRKLSKRVGTYGLDWFKNAYDPDTERVYPSYRQIGSSTGRFSSGERNESPSAQNIPGDYRKFFVAPAGRTFVDVDYSQIEVRVYAKIVGEEALMNLFDAEADVYKTTAANLLGIEEENVTKEERQKAKAIMLGLLYGLSARGLPGYAFTNYGVEILPDEAKELITKFFEIYPAIARDHKSVTTELKATGSVDRVTLAGRRRDGITNPNEAKNAPIQGSAADGLKLAMAAVYRRLKKFNGTAFIVASLHDELLIECDEADAEEILSLTIETMVEAMDTFVNAEGRSVPIKVSGNISEVWTKE
jgi:DNA polymerase-1